MRIIQTRQMVVLVVGILISTAAITDSLKVNIYNWTDYIGESTLVDFQRETGIEYNYDVFDANEVLEAKLMAGHSGYDVVVPSSHFVSRQIRAGIFSPLDHSLLPNYRNLDPEILQQLDKIDPGNRYVVPYLWGTGGLAYNKSMVKELLGVDAIDSWAALFDPQVVMKLSKCGVVVMDSPDELYGAAIHYLGRDVNSATMHDYEEATALIRKIRPYIRYFHSSKFVSDLANGEVCLAVANSGDGIQAIERTNEAHNDVHIEYVVPKEGGNVWFDVLAIPSDAKHKAQAHAFINFLLDPRNIAKVTLYTGYANPTPAAKKFLPSETVGNKTIYPSPDIVKRLYVSTPVSPQYVRYVTRAWSALKSGI
ncbi:extracellular solute-binding protein [Pseudomonas mediterranea]|uniref:polyamine ABC transporter substrate-binding protein n=1 Tax=Pseudomonas mediterranea TaxID=183795 RepID=UPI001318ED55|nr:polyamine ABC transporter substrate-binding protein [Pseudomonas mediterranea]QHA82023.1 extracellular solute-binding protein [Pseudomonas mediterranea]